MVRNKNLERKIKQEKISLTDKITYFPQQGQPYTKDFYVYWTMKNRRTIWNTGIILLVDNRRIYDSFSKAFEQKYSIGIPKNKKYDYLIVRKIDRYRNYILKNR